MKHALKWLKRLLLTGLGLFVFLLVVGAMWHSYRTRKTNEKYPPPGEFVDIGGYKLHYIVEGEGSPIVVIDAGAGEASYDYLHITPEISKFATVVTYDRAGLGWSDSVPGPRDSFQVVDELRRLLKKLDLPPPYVLCGHSFGGQSVRLYASLYPKEVAGLVLIDALATDTLPDDSPGELPLFFDFLCLASRFGAAELVLPNTYPRIKGEPELNELRIAMKCRTKWWLNTRREFFGESDWRQIRDSMKHLGQIPVTVVSTPGTHLAELGDDRSWWSEAQEVLASISNDVERIGLSDCGHWVNAERPEVIVEAVRSVVQRVKLTENAPLGDG